MEKALAKAGLCLILSCSTVSVQAAPSDMAAQQNRIDQIEQQQNAKRQALEEQARLDAPNVNLTPQTEITETVHLPQEKVSFLIIC